MSTCNKILMRFLGYSYTTLSHFRSLQEFGGHPRPRNNTPSSVERFTSTNAGTAAAGNSPSISPARTAKPAQRTRASRKPRRLPRVGICSSAGNSAAEKSKQKKPSAKHPNSFCVNTTSSRKPNAAKATSEASTASRRSTWCRSSVLWVFQKSPPARCGNTGFTATKKR